MTVLARPAEAVCIDRSDPRGHSDAVFSATQDMRSFVCSRGPVVAITVLCVVLVTGEARALQGDVNCDGIVDGQDFTVLVATLFGTGDTQSGPGPDCSGADVNGDGVVNSEIGRAHV